MLFFFEIGFFALALLALALAEFWSRSLALELWGAVTVGSLLASPLVQRRLARTPPADRVEQNWRRALGESWRHLNRLLLLGLLALAAWWWLGTRP